ncbi:hypothetical protein [Chitinimonas sp. BJB300]|uniref:hypothetical protein n=1 Tax=Chitinimonas sp. BJB300 TaxID=1559339 RepID=UPI000C0E3263|nr:hypothetical protein [Chitinimonas sp. BJB300]PHV12910.1 hypothetical protein CSQ89_03210 [Chitinimonas sp. BJB300]TSJ88480.1 hypothetical protein FG002_009880 [Chitinimonas sp. BJB300]
MQETIADRWRLDVNACLWFRASAGSTVRLASGRAYLIPPPQWLADTMVCERVILLGGSTHVMRASGWVVIQAASATELWVAANGNVPSWPAWCLERAMRWLKRCISA